MKGFDWWCLIGDAWRAGWLDWRVAKGLLTRQHHHGNSLFNPFVKSTTLPVCAPYTTRNRYTTCHHFKYDLLRPTDTGSTASTQHAALTPLPPHRLVPLRNNPVPHPRFVRIPAPIPPAEHQPQGQVRRPTDPECQVIVGTYDDAGMGCRVD
jgi:hypothetical protein